MIKLIILSFMCNLVTGEFQFNPVANNTPLIIGKLGTAHLNYDSLKLVCFAELTPLNELKHNIKIAVNTVKNITVTLNKPVYTTAAGQLEHQLNLMNTDEELLETFRTKRFICEWCGKLQHKFSGIMDLDSAKEYERKINDNMFAALDNRELIRNQSRVFEAAIHFNKNTFSRMERRINEFAEAANNQTDKINLIQLEVNENTLIQYTQLLISEYYRLLGQIRRALTNARNGQLMEIIPKKQLSADLKWLEKSLKFNQQMPIDLMHEDVAHVYKYSDVRSTIHGHKIMIEISIPVMDRERFLLYKATPIPIQVNNSTMIASVYSNYFLMNDEQTKYIPMNQKQLDGGKQMNSNQMLYRPTVTTLLSSEGICEWQVLNNLRASNIQKACQFTPFLQQNVLITVIENEIIFVSSNRNQTMLENCNGIDFSQREISGRGTIALDSNCYFKSDNFIVRPHKIKIVNGSQIILPIIPINEMDWANFTNAMFEKLQPNYQTGFTVIQNAEELEKIMDLTKNLVKNADHELRLTELQYDSTTTSWFSGIFSTFSIFGIVASIVGVLFYKCNLLNCIIRAIIKKSTDIQMEPDGSLSFGLSRDIMPKIDTNKTIHQQLNNHPINRESGVIISNEIPVRTSHTHNMGNINLAYDNANQTEGK